MNVVRMTLRISKEVAEFLRMQAEKKGTSINKEINRLIKEGMK